MVNSGGVVSKTVIVWVVLAKFPASSVTVHVTIDSPSGKTCGASLVIVTDILTESVASGGFKEITFSVSDVASTMIALGSVIVGAVVSMRVIFCVAFTVFPEISDAIQVTVV